MIFVPRAAYKNVIAKLLPNKVVIILGARRTGKTSFIKKLLEEVKEPYLWFNGEDF